MYNTDQRRKNLTRSLFAGFLLLIALVLVVDYLPATDQASMGQVIHSSIVPAGHELNETNEPVPILVIWNMDNLEAMTVSVPTDKHHRYDPGDRLIVWTKRGWISGHAYELYIRGDFEHYNN